MSERSAENDAAVIRFDRIGRNHAVPDLPLVGDADDLDNIAEQAHRYAGRFLGSRFYETLVTEDRVVLIEGGRFGRGRVMPPERTQP